MAPRTVWTRPGRTARERRSSGSSRRRRAETARRALGAARRAVHDLVQPVPDLLRAEESELAGLWREWALCRSLTDPAELANRVERVAPTLGAACRQTSEEAARRLTDRNTAWRPAAVRLAEWLDATEKAAEAKDQRKEAEAARFWLRTQTDDLRKYGWRSSRSSRRMCGTSSARAAACRSGTSS
ncbi:hypothetical protein NKH18_23790 [Streptomyces sp. M10(2022)]